MQGFQGKVVVITGAGSGIGRALAMRLDQAGARLALTDINAAGLAETLSRCTAGEVRSYPVDVASREQVFALAEHVQRDFGTAHYLFNNAGVALGASIEHATLEEIEWIMNINLWGVIYGTKAFLPMMLAQGEGHIVNTSSVWGLVAYPTNGAYCITKFGVRALTETLWRELQGTGVFATSVHPAGTKTGMTGGVRFGQFATDLERDWDARQAAGHTTTPEQAAEKILAGVAKKQRRILVSNGSTAIAWLARLFPTHYPAFMRWLGV